MPTLWEIFLYNTVLRELAQDSKAYKQKGYAILEGKRLVRPDFLFPRGALSDGAKYPNGVLLDAKYKNLWGEVYTGKRKWKKSKEADDAADEIRQDLFRVIAYMHLFRCETGGVVFPLRGKIQKRKSDFELAAKGFHMSDPLLDHFLLLPFFIPQDSDHFESDIEASAQYLRDLLIKPAAPVAPS